MESSGKTSPPPASEGRCRFGRIGQWLVTLVLLLVCVAAFISLGFTSSNKSCGLLVQTGATTVIPDPTTSLPTTATTGPTVPSVAAALSHYNLSQPMCPTKHFPETHCVDDFTFVNIWAQFRPSSLTSWTFVDVGANKGYTIVALLQAIGITTYTARGNHDKLVAFSKRERLVAHVLCGACRDCKEYFFPHGSRQDVAKGAVRPEVKVYAFDPVRAHAKYLKETFQSDSNATFTVRQVAISNQTGVAQFGSEGKYMGREEMTISSAGSESSTDVTGMKLYDVPVSTLTKELRDEKLDFIDVLLTDTEGNDFKVAEGAAEWIFAGKVGLYIFEIHRDVDRTLGSHIRRLEKSGYRCYVPIRGGGATQISHECWNPEWETNAGWKNVMCANERLPHLMEAMYTITSYRSR